MHEADKVVLPAAAGDTAKSPPSTEDAEREIGARAVEAALPAFSSWSDDIAKTVSRAGSADAAASALSAWAKKAAGDEAVQRSIYESAMIANMAGQLRVRLIEAPESMTRALSRFALAADGALPDPDGSGPSITFASLPFAEAVEEFRSRGIVSAADFERMDREARQRAFVAAGLASSALQDEAYQGILSALENGDTLADFARELRSGARTLGVSEADPSLVSTIFRTNIATSYMAGRLQQMAAPEVVASHPGVEFRAVLDTRTTSRCVYCNGLQFDRVNDPGWVRFCPPLHYNCRSTVVLLRRSQMNPSRTINSADVDPRGYPMEGFGGAPSLSLDASAT